MSQNPTSFLTVGGGNTALGNFTYYLSPSNYGYLTLGSDGKGAIAKQRLHLLGSNILLTEGNGSNGGSLNGNVFFGSNGVNGVWGIEYYKNTTTGVQGLNFWNPGSTYNTTIRNFALFLADNGNVGIGTGLPQSDLHIRSDKSLVSLQLQSTALGEIKFTDCDGVITTGIDKGFGIYTIGKTPRMVIDSRGNLAFGAENTGIAFFEVNGSSFFTGNMNIGSEVINSTLSVSSLMTSSGKRVVVTDEHGLLSFTDDFSNVPGDNLGDHTARTDIIMDTYGLKFNKSNTAALTINELNEINVNTSILVKGSIFGPQPTDGKNWNKLELFGSKITDAPKIEICDGSQDLWRSIKYITKGATADHQFWIDGKSKLNIKTEKITVGGYNENVDLFVNGKIECQELKISLTSWWPDFVFSSEYNLPSLSEVEQYINKNNHLPGIPSESEIANSGIYVAEMNAMLLKKIEELTLYIIEQQKQIDLLKEQHQFTKN